MQKTITRYDEKPYDTSFYATVINARPGNEDGIYEVILDETLFFPEQGGQTPDRGYFIGSDKRNTGKCQVLDVQIKDGIIIHKIRGMLCAGDMVRGEIDWSHRFSNMQQHTGEHIFSGLVHSKYGYENVGFHLSDSIVTMDFNGPLTSEQVEELERCANDVIAANLPVRAFFPDDEKLKELEYRSKKELTGPIRLVEIPDVDLCACCAPHVGRTGEVGLLKIMSLQNYKGGVRLSLLCGKRALEAFRGKMKTIDDAMQALSSSEEEIVSHIKRIQKENQNLSFKLQQAQMELLLLKAKALPKDAEHALLLVDSCDNTAMRKTVNAMMEAHPGYCGIFAGNQIEGYRFIVGSQNLNCKIEADYLRNRFGARGGGGEQMIQGSIQGVTPEELQMSWIEKE